MFVTLSKRTSEFDILTFFYHLNGFEDIPSEFAKFVEEMCKKARLVLMIFFSGVWPHRQYYFKCVVDVIL